MRSRRLTMFLLGVLVVTVAACDTSPPRFTVPLDVSFVVGGQIGTSNADGDEDAFTWSVPRRLRWGATDDATCPVRYDVEQVYAGMEPDLLIENDTRTHLDVVHDDYDGSFGGGSLSIEGWNVIARDCAGNVQRSGGAYPMWVWQEDGFSPFPPHPNQPTISWSGPWTVQTGAWASGGRQRFTTADGASTRFTARFEVGQHVGLVMAKGPDRGSAAIYVDDVRVGTVDTHAAANDNRRIVFDQRMAAGTHTLSIVNLGTAGHPRIDVDAYLL